MGWRLIEKPRSAKLTKSLAKQFSEMTPVPNDRPFRERRVEVYLKLIAMEQFRPVTWATTTCLEDRGFYRVNGKHTSIMFTRMDKLPDSYVMIEDYESDTLQDVAKLYATFDSKMTSRGANDIYLSFAGTVPELCDVSAKIITKSAPGIAYQKLGPDTYSKSQAPDRAIMLMEHYDFVRWLANMVSGGLTDTQIGIKRHTHQKCSHLLRQPVIAAMFGTWCRAKGPATEFWSEVRDDSGSSPLLPSRKISRYLYTISMKGSERGSTTEKKHAGMREMMVKCLHAWNAWRNNETTNLHYYANAKIPAIR